MNEEQRKKIAKMVSKMAEDARVMVRNVRRDVLEKIKKAQKSSEISEDDYKRHETAIQKLTDKIIAMVDNISQEKEKEILTI
jgi:ribosome recycling factor